MARWRLTAPHYLNVPGTVWEFKEVDRTTGRQRRTQFEVPTLLDPSQPSDCNYPLPNGDGEIVVCLVGKGDPKDIEFIGEPTPDMVPLDDEAKQITAKLASKWKHPIESLPGTYSDALLNDLQVEMAEARSKGATQKIDGMAELLSAMTAMMKQNQDIMSALVTSKSEVAPAESKLRRA